jgi:hypothetical protein
VTITNINRVELRKCIVDEIHARERTDSDINLTSSKDIWQSDSYLLAQFLDNLEAGNIKNEGVKITEFAIKRRKIDEVNSLTLGYRDYVEGSTVEYIDNTQPNSEFIYSIVPVGENGLEGKPNDIQIESDFVGWWIVDKDDINNTVAIDKVINDSSPTISTVLSQGRVQVQTMTRFPQVYYTDEEFHSFTLSAAIIPSEFERSGTSYQKILDVIRLHRAMIIKGGNGEVYICDISNPRKNQPLNADKRFDYLEIQIDAVEINDYKSFMNE